MNDNHCVFALDAKEAKQYVSKFRWDNSNKQVNDNGSLSINNSPYFWTTAGCRYSNGHSVAWGVGYDSGFNFSIVGYAFVGVRPAFWISLE